MKWILVVLLVLPAVFVIAMETDSRGKPETVDELDIDRYLGKWYAIASIVKFFNKDCAWGNQAEYSLREDGRINVVNTCYTGDGKEKRVKGIAWVPDSSDPGKLKVSFVQFLGITFFAGDYWVIELGEDYDYAVIGDPKRSFGWILSRTPEMNQEQLDGIARRLESIGYDFSDFRLNPQSAPNNT